MFSNWYSRVLAGTIGALALLATSAGTGAAKSELYIAIAGIKPGMSKEQVLQRLGRPRRVTTWFEVHGRALEREWHYASRLTVYFEIGRGGQMRRVDRIRTFSPRDRLPNGVHVGLREGVLHRKLVGRLACGRYSGSPGTPFPSGYLCTWFPVKANEPCGANLQFYMRRQHGRIVHMDLERNTFEGCG